MCCWCTSEGYGSNNGMDRLKQLENLLKFGVDDEVGVDTKDLLLQEMSLESFKKSLDSWKPHQ